MAVPSASALLSTFVLLFSLNAVYGSRLVAEQAPGRPTYAGYIPISSKEGSSLYYAYWESSSPLQSSGNQPIVLWLQGGPGCASTFGAFYELGPFLVADGDSKPKPNPWSLNKNNDLLVIDQPIGTGYSIAGSEADIPTDMLGMAQDLYEGIWGFFDLHKEMQQRPLFIAGESYAGKYVPSITHYVLQAEADRAVIAAEEAAAGGALQHSSNIHNQQQLRLSSSMQQANAHNWHLSRFASRHSSRHSSSSSSRSRTLRHARVLREDISPPNFHLAGVAIGNGLTDPVAQTRALPSVIFNMGMVTEATRKRIQDQAEVVIQLVEEQQWPQAVDMRSRLIDFISETAGVATLFDIRRTAKYDAGEAVQVLLNSTEYKTLMQADPKVQYVSCSPVVEKVMASDTMKSATHLVEDILGVLPVLLYQGQFDGQDGVASSNAWISSLKWEYSRDFNQLEGDLWSVNGVPAGWIRSVSTLTQAMIRNAGHMVPRDQPQATQQLFDTWIAGVLQPVSKAKAASGQVAES